MVAGSSSTRGSALSKNSASSFSFPAFASSRTNNEYLTMFLIYFLQSRIIIIPLFGPVVPGTGIAECDTSNAFQILYAIFYGDDESQWRPMPIRNRLVIHFISQYGLGMKGAFPVK